MSDYTLDAHTLVWHLGNNPKLGAKCRAVLNDSAARLIIPSIALAEVGWVIRSGKAHIERWQDVLEAVEADPRVSIVPLDSGKIRRALELSTDLEMHDAQIVATTLLCSERLQRPVTLLTADAGITKSGLVSVFW